VLRLIHIPCISLQYVLSLISLLWIHQSLPGSGCRMLDPVAWRDNHVNFYNRYLLLLEEEYTGEQASRVYSNQCLMATVTWLVLGTVVIFVSAARQLQANRRVVSTGSGSRQPLVVLADDDAGKRHVAVCAPDELCRRKSSSDWLACQRYASLFAVASNTPSNGLWCCSCLCWLAGIVVGSHMAFNGTCSPF
jgi:hypothetical protein